MDYKYTVSARAQGTSANQPVFDGGGFPLKVISRIVGESPSWETLGDTVTIKAIKGSGKITIKNIVAESDVPDLPVKLDENTAGKAISNLIDLIEDNGIEIDFDLKITVEKGLSIKGTGLGSSGASVAAAFKAFEKLMHDKGSSINMSDNEKAKILMDSDFGVPDNSIGSYFGGLVLIDIHDDDISIKRLPKHDDFGYFVIITPSGFGIKTSDARDALLDKSAPLNIEELKQKMLDAFREGDTKTYAKLLEESHQWFVNPRKRLYPNDGKLYDSVYEAGKAEDALGITISGAGPSIIAIVEDIDHGVRVGQSMYKAMYDKGFDSVARIVDIDSEGAK